MNEGEYNLSDIKLIGELLQIYRYPVKSFAGESLTRSKVEHYGLYGDRCYCFVDETKTGWDRYITARQLPQMLSYHAELEEGQSFDVLDYPPLKITAPNGQHHRWDEQLLREIQSYSKRTISMERHSLTTSDKLAVDDGSMLIVTTQALQKLEQLLDMEIDARRFRPNFVIALHEPHIDEQFLLNKRLMIGSSQLEVDALCQRCSMITLDPDTLERNPSILRTVNQQMGLNFGVYASVSQSGEVNAGSGVYLME